MKRKDLKKINNLTKKQIEDIMLLHQLDITDWKRKMSVKDSQINKLKGDIACLKEGLSDLNIPKLEHEIHYWKNKYYKEIKEINFKYALKEKFNRSNVKDVVLLKMLIDGSKISYQDGKLYGFDEQLSKIKQLHPCLFN